MSTETPPVGTLQSVKLFTSPIVHLVDPHAPVLPGTDRERIPALCAMRPIWPGIWIDSSNNRDESLVCKNCTSVKEANERVR